MLKPYTVALLGLGLLSGCSLAPKYKQPAAPVPTAYPTAGDSQGRPASETAWQEFFSDARLRSLIQLALDNNRDLRVSALNVDRVRALYRIQNTALVPTLNAVGGGTRKRTPGDISGSGRWTLSDSYNAGLEIPSYEVDFFGRVMSLRNQVLEQYLATSEAKASAQISLISSVARQYFTLLAVDEQLGLARKAFESANHAYLLNKQTYEAGISSELDLRTAEAQRESYRAGVASYEQARAKAENALVLLVGAQLPKDLTTDVSLASQTLIEDLPAGLPSELLLRRPDLRAAEHTLKAANANIGVARAAFFPAVKLTATAGSTSTDLDRLFTPGQGAWSFAPSLSLPLFAAGKNKATLDVAKIQKEIEVANYEKAIQSAFREVADALAVRATVGVQVEAQKARMEAAQMRFKLTEQRYRSGVDSYLSLLLAQQEFFAAQQAYVDSRLARLQNLTTLYAALGGGWLPAKELKR